MEEEFKDDMTEEVETEEAPEEGDNAVAEVQAMVDECIADYEAGKYASKQELVDAIVEKLAGNADQEPGLGGLGDEESMDLGEPIEEEM